MYVRLAYNLNLVAQHTVVMPDDRMTPHHL